ncbi:zinc finger domain-containing protein [Nocardia nova]
MADETPPKVIPLARGERRLGQNETADLHAAITSVECPDCGAPVEAPCQRTGVDGRLYETRLAHPRRIRAMQQAKAAADGGAE